jgi:hypothetical protein
MAMKLIMEHPENYGFEIPENQLYRPFLLKTIKPTAPISNLAEWAVSKGINIKILRKLNPWLISNELTINPKNYSIKLPSKQENLKKYCSYK